MLNFDYCSRTNESVAEYQGLKIRAVQDSDCGNPWEQWDSNAPLLYFSLGNSGITDHSGGDDIESPLAAFSDYALGRRWRELCSAIGVDAAELEAELKADHKAENPRWRGKLAAYRRDALESALAELKPDSGRAWSAACAYFEALESLWRMAGVAALDFERNGYSQGDSVRGLLVATPRWIKAMGIEPKADMASDLEAQADLFGYWAFGDCFGYMIESPDGDHLDSCFGYYGGDFYKSGLAEAAKEAADSILASAKRKREAKLIELIRSRVPAMYRPALLAEAGKLESC